MYTTNTLFVRTFLEYVSRTLLYVRNPLVCLYTVNFVADVFSNILVCHVCQTPPPQVCLCTIMYYVFDISSKMLLEYISQIRFSPNTLLEFDTRFGLVKRLLRENSPLSGEYRVIMITQCAT